MTNSVTDTPTAASASPGFWRRYGDLWKAAPGGVVYLLAVFVVAMVALSALASIFWTGIGLVVLIVGIPIVVVSLLIARGFGVADRYLLRLTRLPEIAEPVWNRDAPDQNGFWMTLTRPLRNLRYWLSLIHGMITMPLLSTISFTVAVAWVSVAFGGLTYWFWGLFTDGTGEARWGLFVGDAVPWLFGGWSSYAVQVVLSLLAGIVFAFTLPWIVRGFALAHHAVAKGLVGRWASDDLAAEVRAEAAARDAAVKAEDVALRRLERDIHDGPQQRLVRLQMDLAALERRVEAGDADAAADLAREARGHAKAALDELRALSSGVAPPLLQDRGLAAALGAVAAASPLSVTVDVDPAVDGVSPEIARTVYFMVSELFTNAIKHSGATAATLTAALRPAGPAALGMLDVWVVDNGRGGARFSDGHGLEGLRERVAGLRGEFVLDSPLGGPTSVGTHIPLASPPSLEA
ncbi:sensor domain-containing protein [Planococcus sp. APC 4015]|nr:sensor domain-containing protein [Planococcus sp. APC 4015]